MNEMMAGDGSGLALPPAFVFVNTAKKKKNLKKNLGKANLKITIDCLYG